MFASPPQGTSAYVGRRLPLSSNKDKPTSLRPCRRRLQSCSHKRVLDRKLTISSQSITLRFHKMDQSKAQSSSIIHVWKADDDWTELQEMDERKKRQNRLNQRAYRKRIVQKDDKPKKPKTSFRVDRFRLVDVPTQRPAKTSNATISPDKREDERVDSASHVSLIQKPPSYVCSGVVDILSSGPYSTPVPWESIVADNAAMLLPSFASFSVNQIQKLNQFSQEFDHLTLPMRPQIPSPTTNFPFSADHLIRLIHFNTFRGLTTNKSLLASSTSMIKQEREEEILPSFVDLCEGFTVVKPKYNQLLPPNLAPTHHQMTIGHSAWLNMFPHPRLRDNLILNEGKFDAYDFCNDIFGELIEPRLGAKFETTGFVEETEDEITNGRRGLIIWGEPWDREGWEVMPGFVRKWGWVLEGCEDLIASSNRWRAKRDEEPLPELQPNFSRLGVDGSLP